MIEQTTTNNYKEEEEEIQHLWQSGITLA